MYAYIILLAMKMTNLFTFVLLIFLPFNTMSQDAWTRVSPLPQENTINDITKIPGTNRFLAVGDGSTIMTSDDAGETWDIMLHPAGMPNGYHCKGIHFISETTGFINGSWKTILKTTDAGLTWTLKYDASADTCWGSISDICFVDQTTGFASGDNGQLLVTTDIGETWLPVESGTNKSLNKIVFANNMIGFILSNGKYCLKTIDGGLSWKYEVLVPEMGMFDIFDCHFVNETTGFLYLNHWWQSESGFILKTEDSGYTWNPVFENSSVTYSKFVFYDEQVGIASCGIPNNAHKMLLTGDGGNSWTEMPSIPLPWHADKAMIYVDQTTAFSLGASGMIFKTMDGGINWLPKKIAIFSANVYKAQFLDVQNGYVLTNVGGDVGTIGIKKTIDGGKTWTLIYENNVGRKVDFCFLTAETGFMLVGGVDVMVRKTQDGGVTWTDLNFGYIFNFRDVHFFDENHGIIIGATTHYVIKTEDGGLSWQNVSPQGVYAELSTVKYRNVEEVYLGGIGGVGDRYTKILKSSNGGNTWQVIPFDCVSPAQAIAFPDENKIVIAAGTSIFRSEDNGDSWTKSYTSDLNNLLTKSLEFPSSQVGYAIGKGKFSNIEKTTDGGITWFPSETNVSTELNSACFFDENHGMAFGGRGVFLKTTTGGVVGVKMIIDPLASRAFSAAPNPFIDDINIQVNGPEIIFPLQVSLTDITGRELLNQQINGSVNQFSLSVNNLKPGVYFCRIIASDGRKETIKLIRQ